MCTLSGLRRLDKSTIVRTNYHVPVPPGYPAALVRPLDLESGASLLLRPVRPDDEPRLVAFFGRLSARSVYQRFFRAYERLPREWYQHFANVDYRARLALVAEEHDAGGPCLRGLAQYEPGVAPGTTEIAIVVEDAWQRRRVGHRLLESLLAAAEARGLRRFTADVLADNRAMLRLLDRLTDIRRHELEAGVLTLEFERRPVTQHRLA